MKVVRTNLLSVINIYIVLQIENRRQAITIESAVTWLSNLYFWCCWKFHKNVTLKEKNLNDWHVHRIYVISHKSWADMQSLSQNKFKH